METGKKETGRTIVTPNHIVLWTFISLFMIYPVLQRGIENSYVLDPTLAYVGEWVSNLGMFLSGRVGDLLRLGDSALLLVIPSSLVTSIVLGCLTGYFAELVIKKQKHRNIVAFASITIFVMYHLGLYIYLLNSSERIIREIMISDKYRLEIGNIVGYQEEKVTSIDCKVFNQKVEEEITIIDLRIRKDSKEYLPIAHEKSYPREFTYIKAPFVIHVGKIQIKTSQGIVALNVNQDIQIKKIREFDQYVRAEMQQ